METIVNIHQAKTHLSRLLERAAAGERIVIAKAGAPMVCLTPVASSSVRKPGRFTGRLTVPDSFFEPLPDEELEAWEGGKP